jgi:hypothetical protein
MIAPRNDFKVDQAVSSSIASALILRTNYVRTRPKRIKLNQASPRVCVTHMKPRDKKYLVRSI